MTMITRSESFINMADGICRLCLKAEGPMSSIFTNTIFDENDHENPLAAKITSIAQVQISHSDGLPETICRVCQHRVNKFYDFRLLVEISDRTLRSCFEEIRDKSELGRTVVRSTDHDKDVDYEESSKDAVGAEQDLLPVDAIFVPSAGLMQVWQICDAKQATDEEDESYIVCGNESNCKTSEKSANGYRDLVCTTDLSTVSNKSLQNQEELCRSTTTNQAKVIDEDKTVFSNEKINSSIDDDWDYEDVSATVEEYSCQLCLKSFEALDALKSHVSDHFSYKTRSKACSIGVPESRPDNPEPDVINEHPTGVKLEFSNSPLVRSSDEELETLNDQTDCAQKNVPPKCFKCVHCDKSFAKSSSRNHHQDREHRSEKIHKCNECDEKFHKLSDLCYHKSTRHPTVCTTCNKYFRSAQSLKMHRRRHTHGSRYNCSNCEKSYYTRSELARHSQQHTGLRGYPCELCDMSFMSKPELNRHVKYHNGVKQWECEICRKTYYESGHLKVHQLIHTGEKPFACTICEKGFITKSKLARHLKIHNGPRQSRGFANLVK